MNKKKIILIIVLIFIVGISIFLYINRYQLGNYWYNIQMKNINKDITIELITPVDLGGYATTTYTYYVDIGKKKFIKTKEYNVYGVTFYKGEEGPHYSIESIKGISDEQINKILNLLELEEDNEIPSKSHIFLENRDVYYKITYKDKTVTLNSENAKNINKFTNYLPEAY